MPLMRYVLSVHFCPFRACQELTTYNVHAYRRCRAGEKHAGTKNLFDVLRVVQTSGCSECCTKPVSLPAKVTDNCTSRGITFQLGSKHNESSTEKDWPLIKVTYDFLKAMNCSFICGNDRVIVET